MLFLRLHLLQSLLAYVEGNDRLARERLSKVLTPKPYVFCLMSYIPNAA